MFGVEPGEGNVRVEGGDPGEGTVGLEVHAEEGVGEGGEVVVVDSCGCY